MSATVFDGVTRGDLRIRVRKTLDDQLRLDWLGRSNERDPGLVLTPFLRLAMRTAKEAGRGIEMRFEELEYFNSSTITTLIHAIREARTRNLPLTLYFAAEVEWQKLSFDALRVFEKPDGLLRVRTAPVAIETPGAL